MAEIVGVAMDPSIATPTAGPLWKRLLVLRTASRCEQVVLRLTDLIAAIVSAAIPGGWRRRLCQAARRPPRTRGGPGG